MAILAPLLSGPALAQRHAVLLGVLDSVASTDDGVSDFDAVHAPQYRTVWIVADTAGTLTVRASVPELVVPRADGWWHVGVTQVCEIDRDGNVENKRQVVWALPATRAATVADSASCPAQQDSIKPCGVMTVEVEYVSPQLISTSRFTGQTEDCEPRGGRYAIDYAVRTFESDSDLGFGELLGPRARAAYERAVPKKGQSDAGNDIGCGEPDPMTQTGWRIAHALHWYPYVHQDLGYFGCAVDSLIDMRLPARYTGESNAPAVVGWKHWQPRIPGIVDAFVAPRSDMLIAIMPHKLEFFALLHDGALGKPLLELPAERVVMAQWAEGAQIARWSTELAALTQRSARAR